jgi:hypothetical protein
MLSRGYWGFYSYTGTVIARIVGKIFEVHLPVPCLVISLGDEFRPNASCSRDLLKKKHWLTLISATPTNGVARWSEIHWSQKKKVAISNFFSIFLPLDPSQIDRNS